MWANLLAKYLSRRHQNKVTSAFQAVSFIGGSAWVIHSESSQHMIWAAISQTRHANWCVLWFAIDTLINTTLYWIINIYCWKCISITYLTEVLNNNNVNLYDRKGALVFCSSPSIQLCASPYNGVMTELHSSLRSCTENIDAYETTFVIRIVVSGL